MKKAKRPATVFKKLMIVRPSGVGRTAKWGSGEGTVSRVSKGSVFVQWHGTSVTDEMEPEELKDTGRRNTDVPAGISVVEIAPRAEETPVRFQLSTKEAIVVYPGRVESSVIKGKGKFGAAMDGIESLLLALATEGVDLRDPRFKKAVETAAGSVAENLG